MRKRGVERERSERVREREYTSERGEGERGVAGSC